MPQGGRLRTEHAQDVRDGVCHACAILVEFSNPFGDHLAYFEAIAPLSNGGMKLFGAHVPSDLFVV